MRYSVVPPRLPLPTRALKACCMPSRRTKTTWTMRDCQRMFLFGVAIGLVYLLYHLAMRRLPATGHDLSAVPLKEPYSVWPTFTTKPPHNHGWYIAECFDGRFSYDLEEMFGSLIPTWAEASHSDCVEAYWHFTALYEVHQRTSSPMQIPKQFAARVSGWFKGDESLIEKVHNQHLIHVFHLPTSEHAVYNPVRARRPMPIPDQDLFQWVDQTVRESAQNCDFCRYSSMTAVDKFGRHETRDTVRMTNTFKMEAWHSMVVTRHTHHPLNLSRPLLTTLFNEATLWFYDVSREGPHYIYPTLAWDTLFHAGASQLHPHLHMLIAPDHYTGALEGMRSAAQNYHRATGSNYFTALTTVHAALGLAVEYGDAVALANLAGKADLEVVFLSDYPSEDFYSLIYFTVQAYHDTFRQPCKSLAAAWPALGTSKEAFQGRIPAVARMVSRGDCASLRGDFSTFEVFGLVYKSHGPWELAAAIRAAIQKYDK